MRHIINVTILIIVASVVVLIAVNSFDFMPIAASAEAGPIDWLFGLHMNVIGFLYVLVNGILLYSVFVFRRKKGDESEGAYFHSNTGLEITWTIIPLIIVMVFAFLGAVVLNATTEAAPEQIEVQVTSQQWSWGFEYPDLGDWDAEYSGERAGSVELNLPIGRQAKLVMTSTDVTHSFWVPEFRVKQDTVPGQITTLLITPTVVGQYKVRCAELCGTSHAYMLANVNVMTEEDFDRWVKRKIGIAVEPSSEELDDLQSGLTAEQIGADIASTSRCITCHSADGSDMVGPTWQGVFGKIEDLEDGSSVTVDEDYLRESILDPKAKIVAGFIDVMPGNYGDQLSDEEINMLIAYIKSLQ